MSRLFKCMKLLQLILFSLLIVVTTCSQTKRSVHPAFYYWRTTFHLSAAETNYLQAMGAKKLYVKFFDVDWDSTRMLPVPKGALSFNTYPPKDLEIIPTVFITNRTLLNSPEGAIRSLSHNILKKLKAQREHLKNPVREIQFDCDWTLKTRAKYFALLGILRKSLKDSGIHISATIRLHQIKYYKRTGVPPVDRGMLMFYNMGDLRDLSTRNSILDIETAKKYLVNFKDYPLRLDVALPIFSWAVLIRDNRIIRLINNVREKDLADNHFKKLDSHRYQVLKSHYFFKGYLYKNDVLRLETVPLDRIRQSAIMLSKIIKNEYINIAFYHLDEEIIKHYDSKDLKNICRYFD
ncbi:MAG: hypothetical protein IEMM0008_0076 [bacterium]|nr:MAG: hypothetical protein IEMM0008_0076 [bacterium]